MIDPHILLAEVGRMRATSKIMLVQSVMRDTAGDIKRAMTLLEKAQRRLAWARYYKPETEV